MSHTKPDISWLPQKESHEKNKKQKQKNKTKNKNKNKNKKQGKKRFKKEKKVEKGHLNKGTTSFRIWDYNSFINKWETRF